MNSGRKKSGFTIVELLIVIVIVAVLATIVSVAYSGITRRAYNNRAVSETKLISQAVELYHADRGSYPADVERNIPVAIFDYSGNEAIPSQWPIAPWPGSVYDYDYFTGSDSQEVAQISIRFCPIGGPIGACSFPDEPWAADFDVQSSAYWCITGICRAHPDRPDDHPGYCLNCNDE